MGLNRETLPLPTLQPVPVFPKPAFASLSVCEDAEQETLLEVQRDLLAAFHGSRFFQDADEAVQRVQRYSDRYSKNRNTGAADWDWRLFPSELQATETKRKDKVVKRKERAPASGPDALARLPADEVDDKSGEESEEEEAAEGQEEELVEEAGEEETDYALTYFDNGEDYLDADHDDDGGGDEGPTF